MIVSQQDEKVVKDLFDAMQAGVVAEEKMMSLFAEDATFTEPFSGTPQTHRGKDAIRKCYMDMWTGEGPHDLALTMDRLEMRDGVLVVDWTCTSAAFPTPMKGVDRFTLRDGLITDLVFEVTAWPGGH